VLAVHLDWLGIGLYCILSFYVTERRHSSIILYQSKVSVCNTPLPLPHCEVSKGKNQLTTVVGAVDLPKPKQQF
jgi:hypothetical protein